MNILELEMFLFGIICTICIFINMVMEESKAKQQQRQFQRMLLCRVSGIVVLIFLCGCSHP